MELIITETANVARILATFFNAQEKHFGYYSSDKHYIMWTKQCRVKVEKVKLLNDQQEASTLSYKLKLIGDTKNTKQNPLALKKLQILKNLLLSSKSILLICEPSHKATTQLKYLLEYLKVNLPYKMLWLNSLEKWAIKASLLNIKKKIDVDKCFTSYQSREFTYSLIDKRLNKFYNTTSFGDKHRLDFTTSVLLSLVGKRCLENQKTPCESYYKIQVNIKAGDREFVSYLSEDYKQKNAADKELQLVQRNKRAYIVSSKAQGVETAPVLLFDFFELLLKTESIYGFSLPKTLEILKSLYSKGVITYPLTFNSYLPVELKPDIPKLLNALRDYPSFKEKILSLRLTRLYYKDVCVEESYKTHGILTTLKICSLLNAPEKAVYELIAQRCVDVFCPPVETQKVNIKLELENEYQYLDLEVFQNKAQENDFFNKADSFQELVNNKVFTVESIKVVEVKQEESCLFTFTSLLSEVKTAFIRFLKENNKDSRDLFFFKEMFLKFALSLEWCLKQEYLILKNNSLNLSDKGLGYYNKVKQLDYVNLENIFELENLFYGFEKQMISDVLFYKKTKQTLELLKRSIKKAYSSDKAFSIRCRKCNKKELELNYSSLICLNKQCNWTVPRLVSGVYLTSHNLLELIQNARSSSAFDFTNRKNQTLKAYLSFNTKEQLLFEFV